MPRFKVPFEITGSVEIVADDAKHAQQLFDAMTVEQMAGQGALESFDPEEIPRDVEGEQIDRHWDRVKESMS